MSERPRLQRYKADRWIVWIDGVGTAAPTLREAMAAAIPSIAGTPWCAECAGTSISSDWSGEGSPDSCRACNGTGDALTLFADADRS
jgi:hypothetical protein